MASPCFCLMFSDSPTSSNSFPWHELTILFHHIAESSRGKGATFPPFLVRVLTRFFTTIERFAMKQRGAQGNEETGTCPEEKTTTVSGASVALVLTPATETIKT